MFAMLTFNCNYLNYKDLKIIINNHNVDFVNLIIITIFAKVIFVADLLQLKKFLLSYRGEAATFKPMGFFYYIQYDKI